ncbi:phosphatidylglycerophosphatase A family protein [Thioalkalivibrio sp. HK1]|uniref:phosphatidylglycerophosphatase A family protein n=1 Tax=Thioalkalivibrio sp. HK1 TaxID=1469245 RepID=UPI000471DEE3|nr:phosphatidylglycerophosphatase A [Thioalkalivibrio sp. HK1]
MPSNPRPPPRTLVHWIAFGGGAGLSPIAPGTAGTLVAIPIYLAIAAWPLSYYLGFVLAFGLAGIAICNRTARDLEVPDHPGIVIDEIAGFLLAMSALPANGYWIAAAFVSFRLLDISKPWPISVIDRRLKGGLGVMLDDLLAGAMVCVALHALRALLGD